MSLQKAEDPNFWFSLKERKNNFLTAADQEFWNQNPPQEIILATGSVRKALMFSYQLYGLQFPGLYFTQEFTPENNSNTGVSAYPLDLQEFFKEKIFNGNGAFREKFLLGYLHGVPIFAQPSKGETEVNEPYAEAVNKVKDLAGQYRGQNVLLVSTDTVDRPGNISYSLGKPVNETGFPQKENFTDEDYSQAVEKYLEEYKLINYFGAQKSVHINAIAILDGLSGEVIDLPQQVIKLNIPISKKKLANATVNEDMGGGGMSQQFVNWEDTEEILSYMDQLTREEMLSREESVILWALYCQIAGMPFYVVKSQLEKANKKRSFVVA